MLNATVHITGIALTNYVTKLLALFTHWCKAGLSAAESHFFVSHTRVKRFLTNDMWSLNTNIKEYFQFF